MYNIWGAETSYGVNPKVGHIPSSDTTSQMLSYLNPRLSEDFKDEYDLEWMDHGHFEAFDQWEILDLLKKENPEFKDVDA